MSDELPTVETESSESSGPAVGVKPEGETGPKLPGYLQQLPKAELAKWEKAFKEGKIVADKIPANLNSLWTEFQRIQSEVGKAIIRPNKDAPQEQWDAYHKAMGRPDDPEGYTLKKPDIPKGMKLNEATEKWFRETFFKAGLPQETASEIWEKYNERYLASMAENQKALQKAAQDAEAALKTEYGDKFQEKMSLAASSRKLMTDDVFQLVKSKGLDNDPRFIRFLVQLGEKISNDKIIGPKGTGVQPEVRRGMPKTPGGYHLEYPNMRKIAGMGLKEE